MPLLNFIVLLRKKEALHIAYDNLQAAYGNIDVKTFRAWRALYQGALQASSEKMGWLRIGQAGEVVVIDETVVGIDSSDGFEASVCKGVRKSAPQVRSAPCSCLATVGRRSVGCARAE